MTNVRSRLRTAERRAREVKHVSQQNARLRERMDRSWNRMLPVLADKYRSMTDEQWQRTRTYQRHLLRVHIHSSERVKEILLQSDRQLAEQFNAIGEIEAAKRVMAMSERLTKQGRTFRSR